MQLRMEHGAGAAGGAGREHDLAERHEAELDGLQRQVEELKARLDALGEESRRKDQDMLERLERTIVEKSMVGEQTVLLLREREEQLGKEAGAAQASSASLATPAPEKSANKED